MQLLNQPSLMYTNFPIKIEKKRETNGSTRMNRTNHFLSLNNRTDSFINLIYFS